MGPLERRLIGKITASFAPVHFEVVNESHGHNVPVGSETHFKVLIVSAKFEGLARIARQRLVNEAFKSELADGIHALTQRCLAPAEWHNEGSESFQSPACRGGSRRG
jgi:stress-induced morphogen